MSAGGWVALVVFGVPILAALVVFVGGVVAYVRERRDGPPATLMEPWVGRGRLDQLHPARAVVLAWAQGPAGGERDAWERAHAAVRVAMPQLAESLDRMVADARAHADAGVATPVGPCAYGAHVWALTGAGCGGVREVWCAAGC